MENKVKTVPPWENQYSISVKIILQSFKQLWLVFEKAAEDIIQPKDMINVFISNTLSHIDFLPLMCTFPAAHH